MGVAGFTAGSSFFRIPSEHPASIRTQLIRACSNQIELNSLASRLAFLPVARNTPGSEDEKRLFDAPGQLYFTDCQQPQGEQEATAARKDERGDMK